MAHYRLTDQPTPEPAHVCREDELEQELGRLEKLMVDLRDELEEARNTVWDLERDIEHMAQKRDEASYTCAVPHCTTQVFPNAQPEQIWLNDAEWIPVQLCVGHQPHMILAPVA